MSIFSAYLLFAVHVLCHILKYSISTSITLSCSHNIVRMLLSSNLTDKTVFVAVVVLAALVATVAGQRRVVAEQLVV